MKRAVHTIVALLCGVVLLSSCATGTDAVATGGTFDFVSPGGETRIVYDPPADRGTLGTLTGEDLMNEGQTISLDDFEGEVVVVNVWGAWCAPCRNEADDLEEVYQETKDLGVAFLGINVRDNHRDKAQDFVVDQQVGYPSIYDPSMRSLLALGRNYPTSVVPTTVVLDREHRVAAVYLTELLASDLQPVVERLAAEPRQEQ
ncbi:TlpA disulfide reductase family protein [Rhodococcus sp. NPDC060086]|uniref:TlpA disulfide reductase family protein n=1 Tax=Rhodococcus sp. NPDC060086 TaxID=3347055 RepID=UPI003649B5A6